MPWIESLLPAVAIAAGVLLVVLHVAFFTGLYLTRHRGFVDRWTKPLVVASTVLLLATVGAPVAGVAVKLTSRVVTSLASAPATFFTGK